jgi:hypothetical protein
LRFRNAGSGDLGSPVRLEGFVRPRKHLRNKLFKDFGQLSVGHQARHLNEDESVVQEEFAAM